jgi:cytochrome c556
MIRYSRIAAAVLLLGAASQAFAAEESKADADIKYRQSAMTLVKTYFGPLGAMSQDKMPFDKAKAEQYAGILATLSKLPIDLFPAGSEKGDSQKTRAKADIWTDSAKFKQAGDKFAQETAKLAQVAKGNDMKAIKAQIGAVGKTCKACHDDFKEK